MPGRLSAQPPRRRSTPEEEEGDESDGFSVSTPGSTSSKRRRLNDGSSVASAIPEPTNGFTNGNTNGYHTQEADGTEESSNEDDDEDTPQQYQPGSIVRVKLTNFVTYTKAEFNVGPSLNMIIGPNGTGKSTLVCAICLGLSWAPKYLGRAKEVAEFVKHGQKEAEIEIELAAGKGHKKNPVIRRRIRREGNKSTYFLNGTQVPEKEVRQLANNFSIQIDNLCQFLPQDRVAEFAGLLPIARLEETQRAAASPEVNRQHEELKKLYKDLREEQKDIAERKDRLANLQSRQNAARADVERLQERETVEQEVSFMQTYRPFIQYAEARTKAQEAKEKKKNAQRDLTKLKESLEPQLQAMRSKEDYVSQIKEAVVQRQTFVNKAVVKAENLKKKQEDAEAEILRLTNEFNSEKKAVQNNKKKLADQGAIIERLEQQIAEPPIEFDAADFNERRREKQREKRDYEAQIVTLRTECKNNAGKQEELRRVGQVKQSELAQLSSQEGQQFNKLKRDSPDAAQAWKWLQDHKGDFQGAVYGPPILECSIKDKKFTQAIESCVGESNMRAFTCTNQADYRKLQDELLGRNGLKLADVVITLVTQPSSAFKAPVSDEERADYGLQGWAVDYVNGPDAVLAMLCENAQLYRTGISGGSITREQYDRLSNSPIQRWVDAENSYRINRRYGRTVMATNGLKPAKYWADNQVDTGAARAIKEKLSELKGEIDMLKQDYDVANAKAKEVAEKAKELEKEIKGLDAEKGQLQKAKADFDLLPGRLEDARQKKLDWEEQIAGFRDKMDQFQNEQDEKALERVTHALAYATIIEEVRTHLRVQVQAEIMQIEANSELGWLAKENKQTKELLAATEREVKNIEEEAQRIRTVAVRLGKQCTEMDRPDDMMAFHADLGDRGITSEDLENEIQALEARLGLLHTGGGANTLRDYQKRQADIEQIEARVNATEQVIAETQAKIKSTQDAWEPALDALVEKISDAFSENFQQIGCAGQVVIHKAEKFEEWSIKILVKFRDKEELSELDPHRQSGGERAVSTIFYLMALQSLARSPFRVVDEINQGMDPRNERMVHERMVDIACEKHTSQYFLITPKLLHGLKFHKRMKVHCIASGEYMPGDADTLDFRKLAGMALRVMGRA